jgi:hypothetical protein
MRKVPAKITRRQALKIGGGASLIPLLGTAGLTVAAEPPSAGKQAVEFRSIDPAQARLLAAVARSLFPHDFLGDETYMRIAAAIDAKAAADQATAAILQAALAAFPHDFTAMPEAQREDHVRRLERSPFFELVYAQTLTGLYGDPAVSALLGYEGSSVEFGGYINRGFDDISWLPAQTPDNT